MEFDYQMMKAAEGRQREEQISTLPVPVPHPPDAHAQDQSARRKPPVKPRRSIKSRPATQQESGPPPNPPASQTGNEVVVKRLSPAMMLGPAAPLEALSPSLRAHTLLWFHRSQLPRLQTQGQPLPLWLHGFATRRETEQLLQDQPLGCFLLRLSESKIGFVLSYRGKDRCRHFIIEEDGSGSSGEGGKYLIAGENSCHGSLEELITYYTHNPVGPFDEMLTVPYTKTNGLCDDIIRKRVGDTESGKEACIQDSPSPKPASEPLPEPGESASKDTPEYAVVKKALRKSYSLPEYQNVLDTAPPCVEAISPPPCLKESTECVDKASGESDSLATNIGTDVQYARVNKPPRAITQTPPAPANSLASSHQGAMALSAPTLSQASAEQKYWHLEPEHTYEETPATATREEIDFYAMGRRRELDCDDGSSRNHVYSEVNIRGTRENCALTPEPAPIRTHHSAEPPAGTGLRTAPNFPSRPPLRHANVLSRADNIVQQNLGGHFLSTSGHFPPQPSGRALPPDPSAIYEQIPARPSDPRPPLPPLNPKH